MSHPRLPILRRSSGPRRSPAFVWRKMRRRLLPACALKRLAFTAVPIAGGPQNCGGGEGVEARENVSVRGRVAEGWPSFLNLAPVLTRTPIFDLF